MIEPIVLCYGLLHRHSLSAASARRYLSMAGSSVWLLLILDHLPEDSGHFISVHLYERGCHFDLFHNDFLSGINFRSIIF